MDNDEFSFPLVPVDLPFDNFGSFDVDSFLADDVDSFLADDLDPVAAVADGCFLSNDPLCGLDAGGFFLGDDCFKDMDIDDSVWLSSPSDNGMGLMGAAAAAAVPCIQPVL